MRLIMCSLVVLLFSLPALAGTVSLKQGQSTLTVALPEGWVKGFETGNSAHRLQEYLPEGQSVKKWQSMLTIQIFSGDYSAEPGQFLKLVSKRMQGECDNSLVREPQHFQSTPEKAMLWVYCTRYRKTQQGEITLFLAMSNPDGMFIVQRAWRGEPFGLDTMPLSAVQEHGFEQLLKSVVLQRSKATSKKDR